MTITTDQAMYGPPLACALCSTEATINNPSMGVWFTTCSNASCANNAQPATTDSGPQQAVWRWNCAQAGLPAPQS